MPKVDASGKQWWQGCKSYPLMERMYGKKPKTETKVYFGHDAKALLIHAEMMEPDTKHLTAKGKQDQDPAIASDDYLRICFDFDDRAYYHYITVNSKGLIRTGVQAIPLQFRGLDLPGLHKEWPVKGITAKTDVGKNCWTADIRIPFSDLAEWGFDKNFLDRGIRFQVQRRKTTKPAETTLLCPTLQPVWSFPITRFAVGEFQP